MKWITIIILLTSILTLHAYSEAACIFTLINPSSGSRALGDITGVADAWRNDAFASWSNPAIASFHEGVKYGYVSYPYFDDVMDNITFNSSYISIGYHGLGLMLPFINSYNNLGTEIHYGYNPMTRSPYDSYETASEYALSYNVLHHTNAVLAAQNPDKTLDLSIGFSYMHFESVYHGFSCDKYPYFTYRGKSDMMNAGILALFKQRNVEKLRNGNLEISFGLKVMNVNNNRINFTLSRASDPLPRNAYFGVGMFYEYPYHNTANNPIDAKNLYTVKLLMAQTNQGTIENMSSYGMEIGCLDLLYGRIGYYNNWEGQMTGFAEGIGLKLHLDNVEGSFNYSWYHQYEFISHETSFDFTIAYNFR